MTCGGATGRLHDFLHPERDLRLFQPGLIARFWAEVTGWPLRQQDATPGDDEYSVGPSPSREDGPRLYFVGVPELKAVEDREAPRAKRGAGSAPPAGAILAAPVSARST
jgi:hypothetical protein